MIKTHMHGLKNMRMKIVLRTALDVQVIEKARQDTPVVLCA
jgi:hypothetical protein